MDLWSKNLEKDGYQIISSFLSCQEVNYFLSALKDLDLSAGHRRLMARVPEIAILTHLEKIRNLLKSIGALTAFPVRSIFFDKTPETNWLVPWHQDLTIAVVEKRETVSYGPWSVKEGAIHVQPPREVLEKMFTLRLHLDDCDANNGALRVIPGSHLDGKLHTEGIQKKRNEQQPVICSVRAGDLVVMRPLLLHASGKALEPHHRRVIHLEYSTVELPNGLIWAKN